MFIATVDVFNYNCAVNCQFRKIFLTFNKCDDLEVSFMPSSGNFSLLRYQIKIKSKVVPVLN
jgi:hypothetical protein